MSFEENFFTLLNKMTEMTSHPGFSNWLEVMSDPGWADGQIGEHVDDWVTSTPEIIFTQDILLKEEVDLTDKLGWSPWLRYSDYKDFAISGSLEMDSDDTAISYLASYFDMSREDFLNKWENGAKLCSSGGKMWLELEHETKLLDAEVVDIESQDL
jgi:hypothetical protein